MISNSFFVDVPFGGSSVLFLVGCSGKKNTRTGQCFNIDISADINPQDLPF